MLRKTLINIPQRQKGVALLVMIIVIVLAFSSYFISGLSVNKVKTEQKKQTWVALKNAKKALLAYAITHADRAGEDGEIGFLPCPDVNNIVSTVEGNQDISCSGRYISSIGYFPWKSLDLSTLDDDSGTCLMYAVSGSYKLNTPSYMLNEDTNGMFQVVDDANPANTLIGNNSEDRVVAIIFAPGVPMTGQARTFDNASFCGKNYEISGVAVSDYVSEYLEGNGVTDNGTLASEADAVDQFIHATATSSTEATPYNDQFITITRDEIWEAILARDDFDVKMKNLTEALAQCLSSYATANGGNRLPWVAPMNIVDDTGIVDYRINTNYNDSDGTSGYAGRYPFNVDDSNGVIDATIPTDVLFDVTSCNALSVGAGATAATADLVDPSDSTLPGSPTEYRKLWNNWKDHFFYVVSKDYEPVTIAASNPDDDAAVVAANAAANAAAAAASAANAVLASANIIKDATAAAAAALASGDTAAASTFADAALSEAVIIAIKEADADAAATAADVAAAAAITAAAVAGVDPDVATETLAAAAAATDAANAATDAATAAGRADQAATKVEAFVSNNKIPQTAGWADKAAVAATDAAAAAAAADAAELAAANAAAAAAAAAGTAPASCAGNCIKVNGTKRAAVVIFAGSRQAGQLRTGPVWLGANPDINTKHLIENYLENGNELVFPDNTGTGAYATDINEHMFCIDPGLGVSSC